MTEPHRILALVSIAALTLRVPVDAHGVALWKPVERDVLQDDCARCSLVPVCHRLPTATGTALLWRRLGLVDIGGAPTRRGRIVSFFSHSDGLAISAGLEDARYPLDEMIYDLANLDAGFRFCGEENRWAGRLAIACHQLFGQQSIPGYLENGVPPKYGAGAEQIVAAVHKNPAVKHAWVTDLVGAGDIDRIIIEWRSLLRQIAHAPELDWSRWQELQSRARAILNETESPTLTNRPPLEYAQTKRVDHRLIFAAALILWRQCRLSWLLAFVGTNDLRLTAEVPGNVSPMLNLRVPLNWRALSLSQNRSLPILEDAAEMKYSRLSGPRPDQAPNDSAR